MFVVFGNYVVVLWWVVLGGLMLGDLVEGEWCVLDIWEIV